MFPTTRASATKPSILESISSFMAIQNSLNMTLCSPREPDPSAIVLRFEGLDAADARRPLTLDKNGDLWLRTRTGAIRQHKPVAFQKTKAGRNVVASQYVILNDGLTVGFKLGEYDPSLPLIIDPVLSYSVTGIGGSAIAVDAQGQAYVAGIANPAFVPAAGAFQTESWRRNLR